MSAERIFLDLFLFGLGAYVMAGLRELRRDSERDRHPDVPYDEPPQVFCPQCGGRYISWAYCPAIVTVDGEVARQSAHIIRCRQGHVWGQNHEEWEPE